MLPTDETALIESMAREVAPNPNPTQGMALKLAESQLQR